MSRSSPCRGARPCVSTKRWMSSKPAMIRSSLTGRPLGSSGTSKSSSPSASASRSGSPIASLLLDPHERGGAFGQALLPRVLRGGRGATSALLLELQGAHRQCLGLLRRQGCALGGDRGSDLFEAVLAHGLGHDGVGFPKR